MKRIWMLLSLSISLAVVVSGQIPSDKNSLLNPEDIDQAAYAEKNGYPGPKHVIDLADKLQLSEEQKGSVKRIYNEMETRAKELGQRIIDLEEELNKAFGDKLVVEKSIRNDVEQIGRLRGRLRSVYFLAHFKTRNVLNDKQVATYIKLRTPGK